ncbi:hypothetical protein BVG16_23405 [Paenibacillus selenitireducens]|uniref:Carboxypeptidase regulatory-like domain-containing protein n=1 Tax=Paenibacillus selenitireducens TaxID=1324314 RepID=A0A1T2X4U4_9BACL|nr:carboxypeptidase-like regulatory domain-containing protein [Paenibacillus selenitireducens]OPA74706.1 hypothetical protein BVG16_23405 [Paenibacillus selenitireducens]
MPIRDKYTLASSNPFYLHLSEEVNIDLTLNEAPQPPCTRIQGTVSHACGNYIKNALVSIYSDQHAKLFQVKTNRKGRFIFESLVQPGRYYIGASAEGYEASKLKCIAVESSFTTRVSFQLHTDHLNSFGVVYGRVFDSGTNLPLANCSVTLHMCRAPHRIYATTSTNGDGQFLLFFIKPDIVYWLSARRMGYQQSLSCKIRVKAGERILRNMRLTSFEMDHIGQVTGTIVHHR